MCVRARARACMCVNVNFVRVCARATQVLMRQCTCGCINAILPAFVRTLVLVAASTTAAAVELVQLCRSEKRQCQSQRERGRARFHLLLGMICQQQYFTCSYFQFASREIWLNCDLNMLSLCLDDTNIVSHSSPILSSAPFLLTCVCG